MNKKLFFLIGLFFCVFSIAQVNASFEETHAAIDDHTFESDPQNSGDLIFTDDSTDAMPAAEDAGGPTMLHKLLAPARFTLAHEWSYKYQTPVGLKNNRSSFRLEYSNFFLDHFYLQFDTKLTAFWGSDHRAEAENDDVFFETSEKEAFLQVSFADTSIKAGIQVLIWGESEGGAVTDVISPRDYSELFFISLEESRIGQAMLTIDQFSSIGAWSFFVIPDPAFNEYPESGTEYYYDPFDDRADFTSETQQHEFFEYGLRWKKTFGKSDVSLMAAHLVDNDYAIELARLSATGKMLLSKLKRRYALAGLTFNHAKGDFLFRGEIAVKAPIAFNDDALRIIEKDVIDSALGFDYSPGAGAYTLTMECVNKHVLNWDRNIQGVSENNSSLVFIWRKNFLNEDLSVNWMTIYNEPYTAFVHSLTTSYKWDDNITLFADLYYPDVKHEKSGNWAYRDQKQVVFKIQYQF